MIGLAFSAINVWDEFGSRDDATALLLRLIPLADRSVADAIMDVFRVTDALYHDNATRALLHGLLESPGLLAGTADNFLVEKLETLLPDERELVYRICDQIVVHRGNEVVDFRTSLSMSEPHLVNIAITLQRIGDEFRAKGLDLFEKLLVLGANEAQGALNELDHRLPSAERPIVRRRRLPRK
jgi:hypothetical protein